MGCRLSSAVPGGAKEAPGAHHVLDAGLALAGKPGRGGRGKQSTAWGSHGSREWLWRGACFRSGGQSRAQAPWGRQRPGVLSPRAAVSGAWFAAPVRDWPTHRCPHASPGDRARAGATCGCTCHLCASRDHTDHGPETRGSPGEASISLNPGESRPGKQRRGEKLGDKPLSSLGLRT